MVSALGCELTDSSEFHSKTKYLIGTANEAVEKPTFEPQVRPVCGFRWHTTRVIGELVCNICIIAWQVNPFKRPVFG
ncbi:MAG: hypothetical protein ACI9UN_004705 [Granulosicoccus sp.]|jgi:hypothetical protein